MGSVHLCMGSVHPLWVLCVCSIHPFHSIVFYSVYIWCLWSTQTQCRCFLVLSGTCVRFHVLEFRYRGSLMCCRFFISLFFPFWFFLQAVWRREVLSRGEEALQIVQHRRKFPSLRNLSGLELPEGPLLTIYPPQQRFSNFLQIGTSITAKKHIQTIWRLKYAQ